MRKPDFLIVGAPRSATTSMQIYLRQHPQIFFPRRKEMHFFGSDLTRLSKDFWFVLDEDKYLALFEKARDDQLAGEASAMYLYSKKAAEEIKKLNSRMKIIIQLRNPIEMMYSHHGHLVWARNEDIEDFEEALAAEPDRARGTRIPRYVIMLDTLWYRATARYAEQVQRYFDAFGRENVLVIIYDDLRRDLAQTYRQTLEYLGVDPSFRPVFKAVNRHKRARSRFLQQITMKPPAALRMLLRLLGNDLGYMVTIKIQDLNSIDEIRPPMPAELRQRLCQELTPEVERLSALLDRDLTHWVRMSPPPTPGLCGPARR